MFLRKSQIYSVVSLALFSSLSFAALLFAPPDARAQKVDDGSDAAIGLADTRTVLDLIGRHIKDSSDAKVTELRRRGASTICGSVNVKNRDGLYSGERGFVVDLSDASFGRVPDGPELLSASRGAAYEEMEQVRQLYFKMCLD